MDPVSIGLMVAGPIVALIGRAVAEGDFEKARALREQAVAEYGEDVLPVLDRVVAQEVGPSAVANIRGDDALRGRQTAALDELRGLYESGGLTEQDQAALNVAQNRVAQQTASDLASQQQRAARVGQTGNAALESALAAQSGQTAANAMADMGYRAQADARGRAFDALKSEAGLASNVREQDFAEASTKGRAADAFALFNADQRAQAQRQNNANAMSMYDARMGLKGARNKARMGVANDYMARGNATMQTAAGLGSSLSSTGGAIAGLSKKKKQQVEEE